MIRVPPETGRHFVSVPISELRDYLAKTGKALHTVTRLVKAIDAVEKSPVDNGYSIEKLVGGM